MSIYESALRMLFYREHSRFELERKLQQKCYETKDIQLALDKLINEGWLSDTRFVESYLNMRKARGYGPLKIKKELQDRGVEKTLIEAHLKSGDSSWCEMAQALRAKKFGDLISKDLKVLAKQQRWLRNRGFTNNQIHFACK